MQKSQQRLNISGSCLVQDTKNAVRKNRDQLPQSSRRTTLHGLPNANTPLGIFLVTTDPAPMVTSSPITTPGIMMAPPPIQTLFPMVTGSVVVT